MRQAGYPSEKSEQIFTDKLYVTGDSWMQSVPSHVCDKTTIKTFSDPVEFPLKIMKDNSYGVENHLVTTVLSTLLYII